MGLFENPLGHAGYPPNVTGTPSTQPSAVRAATAAEVAAGVIDNAYVSPKTLAEATSSTQGTATLVAGTVTVANTSVTADSRIFLTAQDLGTVTTPSALCVSARTPGTSLTILASQNTDTSTVAYQIFEPA